MHRHKKTISFFILISIVWFLFSWKKEDDRSNEDSIRQWIIEEMVSMQNDLDSIAHAVSADRQIHFYHEARMHYKHLEFFIEFYSRNDARFYFNGPLVPKYEPDFGNTMLPPHGFQRIEEIIYSGIPDTALNDEIKILEERLERAQYYYSRMVIKDGDLIKLCQLELFRIASMNLNGYDASISQTAMQETVWAIDGMEKLLSFYEHYAIEENKIEDAWSVLQQQLALAKSKLIANADYNTFNRLDFIVDNINPLNKAFINFHKLLGQEWNNTPLVLQLNSEFLFGKESLNTQIYYLDYLDTSNLAEQIALGKKLFYDSILSGNNKISCASCHQPDKAFSGGVQFNTGVNNKILSRNTPALLNAVYQYSFFYDGRVYQLDRQAEAVIQNPDEMHGNFDEAVTRMNADANYVTAFRKAFKGHADSGISTITIKKALVEFEKTLVSLNSPFDKYLRGNKNALTKREVNGYNLFAGKALCGSCHFFPLFNGTVPPFFTENEFEVIGTPSSSDNKYLDDDGGRGKISGLKEQLHAFKTPSVRNIAITAPYMHNGIYTSLEQVIDFYHKGGGAGLGFDVSNQTLPFDSLQLNKREKEDIILFMKSLTDTTSFKKN